MTCLTYDIQHKLRSRTRLLGGIVLAADMRQQTMCGNERDDHRSPVSSFDSRVEQQRRRECGGWRFIYTLPPKQRLLSRVMAIILAEEVVIVANQ